MQVFFPCVNVPQDVYYVGPRTEENVTVNFTTSNNKSSKVQVKVKKLNSLDPQTMCHVAQQQAAQCTYGVLGTDGSCKYYANVDDGGTIVACFGKKKDSLLRTAILGK
jgi:hypothetical protein